MADVSLRFKNPQFAVFCLKEAVNSFQTLRENLSALDRVSQRSFLRKEESAYRSLVAALIDEGRLSEAQQALDRFKDQQSFDYPSAALTASPALDTLELTEREQHAAEVLARARDRISTMGKRYVFLQAHEQTLRDPETTRAEAAEMAELEPKVVQSAAEYTNLMLRTAEEFRATAPDVTEKTRDTRAMQSALSEMQHSSSSNCLAIYVLINDRMYYSLLITARDIRAVSKPINGQEFNEKVTQMWATVSTDKIDPRPLGQEIYNLVLRPLENYLPQNTNVVMWSLDGTLRYIPMAALYDGKQYLVERFANVVFTRINFHQLTKEAGQYRSGLGLGTSKPHVAHDQFEEEEIDFGPLPGVTEELNAIFRRPAHAGGVIEGEVLEDASFTRSAMFEHLRKHYPLVHIASHFHFEPGEEGRSVLLLGDGSLLSLADLDTGEQVLSGVELITPSACSTAAQLSSATGREIDGFAELAQRIGADSVLATLWSASDASTPYVMQRFYAAQIGGSRLTKAEALREAQLALLKGTTLEARTFRPARRDASQIQIAVVPDGEVRHRRAVGRGLDVLDSVAPSFVTDERRPFAHPYYWAPFVLFGNWK